jgi:IclR family transcriptional regulator, pca regulon regulatory protein
LNYAIYTKFWLVEGYEFSSNHLNLRLEHETHVVSNQTRRPMMSAPSAPAAGDGWQARITEARHSQSLERGLAVLGRFTADRPVLGIADIAQELAMTRSTAHRYVCTLLALGYLDQGTSRKYRLGVRVTDLGLSALASTGLREHAHPYLQELSRCTGHTASFGVLDGSDALYVDRVNYVRRTRHPVDLKLAVGSRVPAHAGSMGRLLLANLPDAERKELLEEMTLPRLGPDTIVSKDALQKELERIKGEACVVEREELAPGMCSIASPVRNSAGEVVAAVTIEARRSRISPEQLADDFRPHLVTAADHLSAGLTGSRARPL